MSGADGAERRPPATSAGRRWPRSRRATATAWLALFADDAVVEDPVGPSAFDPEGTGHRGPEAIAAFYDNVIGANESIRFDHPPVVPVRRRGGQRRA